MPLFSQEIAGLIEGQFSPLGSSERPKQVSSRQGMPIKYSTTFPKKTLYFVLDHACHLMQLALLVLLMLGDWRNAVAKCQNAGGSVLVAVRLELLHKLAPNTSGQGICSFSVW